MKNRGSSIARSDANQPRQAVWSARASVVESNGVDDQIPTEASTPPASEIGSDQSPIEDTTANADSVPWRDDAQLNTHLHDRWRSVGDLRVARRSRSRRLGLCLAAVIGLVVVLTGRGVRRSV